ncbi:MAG: hypothetical protein J5I98_05180 [Phaeodactylibacter sp.]|nr:hypothetical protein [Phaeodactylibacter sp.]
MKGIAVTAIFILAACNGTDFKEGNGNTNPKAGIMQKEEKQKIENLLSEYQRSLNTSDAKLAQSLYTKDGAGFPSPRIWLIQRTRGPRSSPVRNILL